MHLSLSDLVTCPRCGPSHGLVLLPSAVRDRRVETGVLGCSNCRERYRIEASVVDLRQAVTASGGDGDASLPAFTPWGSESDAAVGLAALLGLADVSGPVLLAGPASSHAAALARLLEQVEVVVLVGEGDALPSPAAAAGVTYVLADGVVPFRGGALAAAALTGGATALAEDALRAVRPTARVLLDPAGTGSEARITAAGGAPVFSDGSTLVVARRT